MLKKVFALFLLLLLVSLVFLKVLFGWGKHYPGLKTSPLLQDSKLSTLVELPFPPGNVTVSSAQRIFFNYHPFAKAERFSDSTLFELKQGAPVPFPSVEAQKKFQGVFGLTADLQNRLWLIEPAGLDFSHTVLSAIDLGTAQVIFRYEFPEGVARFAQDLRVTADGKTIILADTGFFKFTDPGLFLFDIEKKTYRSFLAKNSAARPQNWTITGPLGEHHLAYGFLGFFVGLDGIEITHDQKWLYFGAMTHDSLYRIPLTGLLSENADEKSVSDSVERMGQKPLSDGITELPDGNILLTDVENGGLAAFNVTSKMVTTLISSPKIIWADGVVRYSDHSVLFTDSSIPSYVDQLARPPSLKVLEQHRPYRVYRLDLF